MGLRAAHSTSRTTTRLIALSLLLALPDYGLSQPASEPETGQRPATNDLAAWREHNALTARRFEAIREEESRSGPHSETLIDELASLGMLYQEGGRYDLAAESFERALQIKRVNEGLYTFDQAPLLRLLLAAERSRGNFEAVQSLEDRLVRLARMNPDDSRTVSIFREAAERRLSIYRGYLDGELPPEINISIGAFGSRPIGNSSNRAIAMSALRQARESYWEALEVLIRTQASANDQLQELERELIGSYYLEMSAGDSTRDRTETLYRMGKAGHERLVMYSALHSGTVIDVAKALVELADWDLLFSRNGSALNRYREAYELLTEHDAAPTVIDELFSPDTPVALPAFAPKPITSQETDPSEGHVDVTFRLTRYGRSRRIEVLDATGDAAEAAEKNVTRFIARSRFRPKMVDGETRSGASFVVRYYY